MTHNEDPWKETFREGANEEISLEVMENFYKNYLSEGQTMGRKRKDFKIVTKSTDRVNKYDIPTNEPGINKRKPIFSFEHYDNNHNKYSFKAIKSQKEFCLLFNKLKEMSSLTWGEIKNAAQFHCHEVNWKKDM